MQNAHIDIEDILRFRHGEMSGPEVRDVADHLAACRECSTLVEEMFAHDAAAALSFEIEQPRSRWRYRLAMAASVSAAVVGLSLLLWHGKRPYERSEWNTLVSEALTQHAVTIPRRIATDEPDELRGAVSSTASQLMPDGTVVESTRPDFLWPAVAGASYVVIIARDGQPVSVSAPLLTNHWRPSTSLSRGTTYEWQVRVTRGDEVSSLPAPPQRNPGFAVLGEAAAADLAAAQSAHPRDHLLIGVLAAHYGLREKAERELAQYAAEHPSASANELAASVNRRR